MSKVDPGKYLCEDSVIQVTVVLSVLIEDKWMSSFVEGVLPLIQEVSSFLRPTSILQEQLRWISEGSHSLFVGAANFLPPTCQVQYCPILIKYALCDRMFLINIS